MDLYLAVYPATVLFTLQMKLKKRIALSIALGIGSVFVLLENAMFMRELTTLFSASVVAIYKVTRLSELASRDFSCTTPLSLALRQ